MERLLWILMMMTDEIKPWRVLRPKGPPTFIKSIMLPRNHNENPHFTLANTLFLSSPLSLHNDHNRSYIGVTVVHSPLRLASRTTIGPNALWPCGSSVNSYRTVCNHIQRRTSYNRVASLYILLKPSPRHVAIDWAALQSKSNSAIAQCHENAKGLFSHCAKVNWKDGWRWLMGRVNCEGQYKYDSQEMFKVKVKWQFHHLDPDIQDRIHV